jgi:polyisoprenoid-binding protein YceI
MSPRSRPLVSLALILSLGLASATTQWTLQPAQSTLTFVGTQAGAEFEGGFDKFTADIKFDPRDLGSSRIDVRIDLSSVNTKDAERDDILKGSDLFDVKQWPSGHYVAETFTDKGGGRFSATGKLTLRDITRDVPIEFTFQNGNDGAWLKGSAVLKRLDFGVGQGEWKDTETVANEVQIRFAVLLK